MYNHVGYMVTPSVIMQENCLCPHYSELTSVIIQIICFDCSYDSLQTHKGGWGDG